MTDYHDRAPGSPARQLYYALNGKLAIPCAGPIEWAQAMAGVDPRVAQTQIDDIEVSTVFLGIDCSLGYNEDPAIFETMVFDPDKKAWGMKRYFIWEEAEAGHAQIVREIQRLMESARVSAATALMSVQANFGSSGGHGPGDEDETGPLKPRLK